MTQRVLDRLTHKFGEVINETRGGSDQSVAVVRDASLLEVALFLRDDPDLSFDMPIDCTAVDWHQKREPRFDVVFGLYSTRHHHRLRLVVRVSVDDPSVASLTSVWRGMNWHERECFDMYGIRFSGHPKLRRLLMYDEFVGHPLRKDYPVDKRQPLLALRPVHDVPTQRQPPPERLNQP